MSALSTIGEPVSAQALAGLPHVCALTLSAIEHETWLAALVADSHQSRHKTFLILDPRTRAASPGGLQQRTGTGRFSGSLQVEMLDWTETYLESGRFVPSTMLATIERLIDRGTAEGYDRVRIVGDMGWAAAGSEGIELLLGYESELDNRLAGRSAEVLCVYDLAKFSGAVVGGLTRGGPQLGADVIVDVLHAHPALIFNGDVVSNPVYGGANDTLAPPRTGTQRD